MPWTQLAVSPAGTLRPCCIFDGSILDSVGKPFHISDSIQEAWNSPHLKDIRLKMLEGAQVPACTKCFEEEKSFEYSDRHRLCHFSSDTLQRIKYSKKTAGLVPESPKILNLKVGNTCNLKCRMCQPVDSSSIDSEFYKISEKYPEFRNFDNASAFDYEHADLPVKNMKSWLKDPKAYQNLQKLLPGVDHVSFAGGEVFVMPEAMEFLRMCVETGMAKNLSLVLNSNLTKLSEESIALLCEFKKTRLFASIDGIGELGEYIRFPSKWPVVFENFTRLLKAPGNLVPLIAPVIQAYNVLNAHEIFEMAEDLANPKWERALPLRLTILMFPHFLSIRDLPRSVKDTAYDRILQFYQKSYYAKKHEEYGQSLQLLMQTLKSNDRPKDHKATSHFLKYTQIIDEQRGQSFQKSCPELFGFLEEAGIHPSGLHQ